MFDYPLCVWELVWWLLLIYAEFRGEWVCDVSLHQSLILSPLPWDSMRPWFSAAGCLSPSLLVLVVMRVWRRRNGLEASKSAVSKLLPNMWSAVERLTWLNYREGWGGKSFCRRTAFFMNHTRTGNCNRLYRPLPPPSMSALKTRLIAERWLAVGLIRVLRNAAFGRLWIGGDTVSGCKGRNGVVDTGNDIWECERYDCKLSSQLIE